MNAQTSQKASGASAQPMRYSGSRDRRLTAPAVYGDSHAPSRGQWDGHASAPVGATKYKDDRSMLWVSASEAESKTNQ
jgi:hypothetical protein